MKYPGFRIKHIGMRLRLSVLAAAAVLAWSPGELLPFITFYYTGDGWLGSTYVGGTELVENNNHELCLLGEDPGPERRETVRQERRREFYILH